MDKHFEDIFKQYERLILIRKLVCVVVIAALINTIAAMVNRCLGYGNMFLLSIQTLASFIAVMGILPMIILNYQIYPGISKSNALFTMIMIAAMTGWIFLFVDNLQVLIALS